MMAWMRWARTLASTALGRPRKVAPSRSGSRKGAMVSVEGLEGRAVLSATGLSSFATLPVHITSPTSAARVTFQFQAGEITAPAGKPVYLGFNPARRRPGRWWPRRLPGSSGPPGAARHRAHETGNQVFITKVGIPVGKPAPSPSTSSR